MSTSYLPDGGYSNDYPLGDTPVLGFGGFSGTCALTPCARLNLGVHAWAFGSGRLVHGTWENQPMHIQDLVKICHSNYSLALHYGT